MYYKIFIFLFFCSFYFSQYLSSLLFKIKVLAAAPPPLTMCPGKLPLNAFSCPKRTCTYLSQSVTQCDSWPSANVWGFFTLGLVLLFWISLAFTFLCVFIIFCFLPWLFFLSTSNYELLKARIRTHKYFLNVYQLHKWKVCALSQFLHTVYA